MARIRTIKPDFWTDGAMVQLSPFARLLYIGMWNFTMCDHGHVADDAMKLKLQILPMDNVNIVELLDEILDLGRVTRVEDEEGRKYLHIKRFEDHQKIDPRWKTRCPACAQKDSLKPTETQVSLGELPDTPQNSQQLTLGRDGKGWEGKNTSSPAAPSMGGFDEFWSVYPKKVSKQAAIRAWKKAIKHAEPEAIIRGAKAYAETERKKGTERDFLKGPDGWLNAGRWEDELTGVAAGEIDVDAILGRDLWTPPAPPDDLPDHEYKAWLIRVRREHDEARYAEAQKRATA